MSKQKIKIMDKRVEVSEEDIRSYMNFEEVLAKRNTIANGWNKNFLKWSIPVVATISVLAWLWMNDNVTKKLPSSSETIDEQAPASPKMSQESTTIADLKLDTAPKLPMERRLRHPPVPKETLSTDVVTSRVRIVEIDSPTAKTGFKAYSPAEPVQGYDHLYQYFNDNLRYPQEALKDSIEGVLNVNFVINEEGKPEHITFANSFGAPFELEAIRVIESMPAWEPALLNGRPVKSKVSLPLTFKYHKVTIKRLFKKKLN